MIRILCRSPTTEQHIVQTMSSQTNENAVNPASDKQFDGYVEIEIYLSSNM